MTESPLLLLQFRVDGWVLRPQTWLQAAGGFQGALSVARAPALGRFGIGEQFWNCIGSLRAQLSKTLGSDVTVNACARLHFIQQHLLQCRQLFSGPGRQRES